MLYLADNLVEKQTLEMTVCACFMALVNRIRVIRCANSRLTNQPPVVDIMFPIRDDTVQLASDVSAVKLLE